MESLTSSGPETASANGAGIAVENPATGETLAHVPETSPDQVREVVAAARRAQQGWADAGFEERGRILMAARAWMVANGERVVTTICAETGRPADETQFAELSYGSARSSSGPSMRRRISPTRTSRPHRPLSVAAAGSRSATRRSAWSA